MRKKAIFVCFAVLAALVMCELFGFARAIRTKREARELTEVIAALKPGYTTKDDAIELFQAHKIDTGLDRNACNIPGSSCEGLFAGVSTYVWIVVNRERGVGFHINPLPPVNPATLGVNLYFINGVLNSINDKYEVGTTTVAFSRYAGDHEVRTSEWKYTNGGMVTRIGVAASGAAFDGPFPQFDFNYMYSIKCTDARLLWPSAPPPTIKLNGWPGCR